MPTYKNITLTIHTPWTLEGLPEIAPPSPAKGTASATASANACSVKELLDEKWSRVSVFVPVLPQSLFWLSYSIHQPPQDGTFFVFKLLVNKEEVVTWCCDSTDKWQGKTMFGLFGTGKDETVVGGAGMEKRVFKFGQPGEENWRVVGDLCADGEKERHVEVRVLRANMKMRIPRELEMYQGLTTRDMSMINGSTTSRGHPRAYYKFGLLDSRDDPYATFRFYYRTWEEIDELDLRMGQVDIAGSDSIFADRASARASTTVTPVDEQTTATDDSRPYRNLIEHCSYPSKPVDGSALESSYHSAHHSSPDRGRSRRATHIPTAAQPYGPRAAPVSQIPLTPSTPPPPPPQYLDGLNYYSSPAEHSYQASEPEEASNASIRRLSIPPSTILRPFLERGQLPLSPNKPSRQPSSAGLWEQPPARKRAETGGMLMGVMANALKRRTTDSAAR